jgi:ABC-type Zn uptake system ZnuABC Zn-binding protein ZnuA
MNKVWKVSTAVLFAFIFSYQMIPPSTAAEQIKIVATTKTFASLVEAIGGDLVKVDYVAPPNQNVHFIQPRPSDILRLSKANLFVHAGLDLELWRYPLAEASGKADFLPGGKRELDLSRGIQLLEVPQGILSRAQGDIHIYGNPHYWLDPRNGKIMARTIYQKLAELDPAKEKEFKTNLDQFLQKCDLKMKDWENQTSPLKGQTVVTYHNSWPYFADFSGIEVAGFVEPKPGIPPTAKHIAELIQIMKGKQVKAIVKESFFENKTPRRLAKETGAAVLTLASGVGEVSDAADYFTLFDYNLRQLKKSLVPLGGEGHA